MAAARNLLTTFTRSNRHIANATGETFYFLNPRRYVRLNTALPRCVNLLLDVGQPGDVAEISHAEHGFQIATVKIHAGGKIDIKWTITK